MDFTKFKLIKDIKFQKESKVMKKFTTKLQFLKILEEN